MKNKGYLYIFLIILILVSYNALLMRMLPFSKVSLKCEFKASYINTYEVPKRLDLIIRGYGYGKFTNEQMFGNNSFSLRTSNPEDKFLNRLIGTSEYYFYIGKENSEWETYMFTIAKKDNQANERILMLDDYSTDENEHPFAMWYCSY